MIRVVQDTDDAVSLSLLGRSTFIEKFGHLYASDDLHAFLEDNHSVETYDALIQDKNSCVWVAESAADQPIGYAVAGPCSLPVPDMPPGAGELKRLYVESPHQGAGLGAQLMACVLPWMQQQFSHLYLSVYSENYGAQRFYRRYGFEKIHDYHFMVGNHADPEFIFKELVGLEKMR